MCLENNKTEKERERERDVNIFMIVRRELFVLFVCWFFSVGCSNVSVPRPCMINQSRLTFVGIEAFSMFDSVHFQ